MRALTLTFLLILAACSGKGNECLDYLQYKEIDLVLCSDLPNAKTFFVFGQSNSANHSEGKHTSKQGVYMAVKNGFCVRAQDPIFNATGCGGSIWTRLGDKILEQRPDIENVVFLAIGVGGSSIEQWAAGDLVSRLKNALSEAQAFNIDIDYFLFQQGETDGGIKNTKENYKASFLQMLGHIREYYDAPVLAAKSTRCDSDTYPPVAEAIDELVSDGDILAGPDTDSLDESYRDSYRCHFSWYGLSVAADMWLDSINEAEGI